MPSGPRVAAGWKLSAGRMEECHLVGFLFFSYEDDARSNTHQIRRKITEAN